MPTRSSRFSFRPSLAFVTLSLLLLVLWLAGGASRGDVAGQLVVRTAAFLALMVVFLFGRLPMITHARPVWIILGAAITIAALQLIPLPTSFWYALPGRPFIAEAVGANPQGAWQPLSLVPGATVNALIALVVPLAVLILTTALSKTERAWLPEIVLILAVVSMLLGLLQFTGIAISNSLVNDTPGAVSGTFANRNHFALFLALGCLFVPVWVFREGARVQWRGPVGLGLLLLFMLTILASGSRAGLAVGALAIGIAGILALSGLRRRLRHAPRWVLPAALAAAIAVLAVFALVSVVTDRAVSIQRSMSVDVEQDMRSRAFPTIWKMVRETFPLGTGAGTFDPVFRSREPLALLKPTYFNHAHNDFIEVALGSGLPGVLLLFAVLAWWAWASVGAWRNVANQRSMLQRLGSAMILLVVVGSAFDYPARTPLIMALMVLAGVWLSGQPDDRVSALPPSRQHL